MQREAIHTAKATRSAMGVTCVATIVGPDAAVIAHRCLDYVVELEHLWSRFDPLSDITRLNNAGGAPVWVDARTTQLLHHAIRAHTETRGAFNPTLLPLQIAAGDIRSLVDNRMSRIPSGARPYDNLDLITFHAEGRITIPAPMTLDMGGMAKGFAADATAQYARSLGATGVCINIGGDMALDTGDIAGWDVEILSPRDYSQGLDTVRIAMGGVATSSLFARSRNGRGIPSHLFSLNGPHHDGTTVGATVVANTAAWAEVWTKFAILDEPESALATLNEKGLAALLVSSDGSQRRTNTWKNFTHE